MSEWVVIHTDDSGDGVFTELVEAQTIDGAIQQIYAKYSSMMASFVGEIISVIKVSR